MAHLRSKKLKCSEAYDMKSERESRRRQTKAKDAEYQRKSKAKKKAKNPKEFAAHHAAEVEASRVKKKAKNGELMLNSPGGYRPPDPPRTAV